MKLFNYIWICLFAFQGIGQTVMSVYQNTGLKTEFQINQIDSITFTVDTPGYLASVITKQINILPGNMVLSGGEIPNDGGTMVTQKGICWSNVPYPTTADSKTIIGSVGTEFSSELSNLLSNTTYYVRAYAINNAGTSYGNQVSFTFIGESTPPIYSEGSPISFGGYTYKTIIIGDQEWFAENLRTEVYANGDSILNFEKLGINQPYDSAGWMPYQTDSLTELFGKRYTWYTTVDNRNVCPAGWHVPSNNDWAALSLFLGGDLLAGNKIKTNIDSFWMEKTNSMATNLSGFSGLPGGLNAGGIGYCGAWWSTTSANIYRAYIKFFQEQHGIFITNPNIEKDTSLNNIRCVKD